MLGLKMNHVSKRGAMCLCVIRRLNTHWNGTIVEIRDLSSRYSSMLFWMPLTHWGRVTHLCVSKLTSIASDNGLSPGRRQAIIWSNAGILLIGHLGTNFIEILIGIQTFSFKKMHLKMSSAKCRPFCLCLNELKYQMKQCVVTPVQPWCRQWHITCAACTLRGKGGSCRFK